MECDIAVLEETFDEEMTLLDPEEFALEVVTDSSGLQSGNVLYFELIVIYSKFIMNIVDIGQQHPDWLHFGA